MRASGWTNSSPPWSASPANQQLLTDRVVVGAGRSLGCRAQWAQDFYSASAVLGKPAIHVDADSLTISY